MLAVTPAASSTRGSSCSQHRRLSRMSSSQRQTSNIFDLDHHHVHQVHFLARPIGCVARHQLCTRLTLRHAGVGMKPRLQLASTFVPSLSLQRKDTRHLDIAEHHPCSCCCPHPHPKHIPRQVRHQGLPPQARASAARSSGNGQVLRHQGPRAAHGAPHHRRSPRADQDQPGARVGSGGRGVLRCMYIISDKIDERLILASHPKTKMY